MIQKDDDSKIKDKVWCVIGLWQWQLMDMLNMASTLCYLLYLYIHFETERSPIMLVNHH